MRRTKKIQLIEFKGNTLSVIVITLRSLQPEELAKTAEALFGNDAFFEGDAALLDLGQIPGQINEPDLADWAALKGIFEAHGLHIIGVRGACDALRESAMAAGLPDFPAIERAPHKPAEPPAQPVVEAAAAVATTSPAPLLPVASVIVPTLIVDRPLRSGQQVYARGGDLVVLAAVSSGAEVIADGSIHIYAPLRGRALAGANGAPGARIFTTRFEAELVSIAGIYRTFETGVPDNLAGQPVQIQLSEAAGEAGGTLSIVPLQTR